MQQRITWTPASDGSVRQLWELSSDAGKTWTVLFDGRYVRAPVGRPRQRPARGSRHNRRPPRARRGDDFSRAMSRSTMLQKPHPRRLRARVLVACALGRAFTLGASAGRSQGAAGRRLRLRDADRRGRLDVPARARPARDGARARRARAGRSPSSRSPKAPTPSACCATWSRSRARSSSSRPASATSSRRCASPPSSRRRASSTPAATRRAQPRHLRRALLRGALARRLARRSHEQERRRRLRRRLPGARGRAGHQRVRARHAGGESEGDGARRLARTPGSIRRRSATPRKR